MKIEIKAKTVRFSQITPGHCFIDQHGATLMRIRQRDGDKSDAVNLNDGQVVRYVNTATLVTPVYLKVVENEE